LFILLEAITETLTCEVDGLQPSKMQPTLQRSLLANGSIIRADNFEGIGLNGGIEPKIDLH